LPDEAWLVRAQKISAAESIPELQKSGLNMNEAKWSMHDHAGLEMALCF
jgi:hypothetical protein